MSQNEDTIYALLAQAQEMQKFALEFQGTAEDTLKKLPEGVKNAVRDVTREILVEGAKEASRGLLDASRGAIAAASELRNAQTWSLLKHVLCLFLVAVVISAAVYFGLGFLAKQRADELDELTTRARAMAVTVEKLEKQYGKAVFSTCGGRPCVRVDERLGRYGEAQKGEVYYVLFNY